MKKRHLYREREDLDSEKIIGASTALHFEDPSKTKQSFKADADLNNVIARFRVDINRMPEAPVDPRRYGDFSDVGDFRDAMDRVRLATQSFQALPANIRNRFNNDPQALYRWVNDPEHAEEAVKLGLLAKKAPEAKPEPQEVRIVNDPRQLPIALPGDKAPQKTEGPPST